MDSCAFSLKMFFSGLSRREIQFCTTFFHTFNYYCVCLRRLGWIRKLFRLKENKSFLIFYRTSRRLNLHMTELSMLIFLSWVSMKRSQMLLFLNFFASRTLISHIRFEKLKNHRKFKENIAHSRLWNLPKFLSRGRRSSLRIRELISEICVKISNKINLNVDIISIRCSTVTD